MAEQSDFNKFKQECIEGMNEYVRGFGYRSYDAAPNNIIGKALTAYYINEILADLKNLDEDTIEEGLALDKKGDLGVDFVHKVDRTHHIYQSKFRSWNNSNSLTVEDVLKFIDTHRKIISKEELAERANAEVKAYFQEAKPRDQYAYYLISNKPVSEAVRKDFDYHRAEEKKKYKGRADWFLCDATVLVNDWTRVKTQLDSIPGQVPINFDLVKGKAALFEVTDYLEDDQIDSVLCLVKGTELKNLYNTYQDALFSYNIRGYLGKNPINEGIENTISSEPEHFYFFNNGISAICKTFKISEGKNIFLKCENFQIINGAQTVSVIASCENNDSLRKIRVLMRVSSTQDEKSGNRINQKIIHFNNSQSQIKDHDHHANDEVQVAIEKYFSDERIKFKGCLPHDPVHYVRKRIDKKRIKAGWKIDLPEMARALCAFSLSPVLANSSPKKMFDSSEEGLYWQIFGEAGGEVKRPSEERFHSITAIALLWLFIKQCLSEIKKNKEGKWGTDEDVKITQAKWHYLRCFGLVIEKLYTEDERRVFFNKVTKGKSLDINSDIEIFKKWFRIVHLDIKEIYKMTIDREANGIWRNWLRDKKVLALLEDRYKDESRIAEYFIKP